MRLKGVDLFACYLSQPDNGGILPAKEQLPFAKTAVSMATIVRAKQLTADNAVKKTLLLELDVKVSTAVQ